MPNDFDGNWESARRAVRHLIADFMAVCALGLVFGVMFWFGTHP